MLTPLEREFLEACREARALVERENRQSRMIRRLSVASLIVAIIAIIAAAFGVSGQRNATQAARKSMATAEYAQQLAVSAQVSADRGQNGRGCARSEAQRADQNNAQAQALLNLLTTTTPTPPLDGHAAATYGTGIASPRQPQGHARDELDDATHRHPVAILPLIRRQQSSDLSVTATVAAMKTIADVQTQLALSAVQQPAVATPTPNLTAITEQTQAARPRATPTILAVTPPKGRIVFASNRDGPNDLYIMNADGSGVRRVTDDIAYLASYALDTDRIVFTTASGGNTQLSTIRPEGTEKTDLDTTPNDGIVWDDWDPAYSQDGSRIAFVSTRENRQEIYSLDIGSGIVLRLTDNQAKNYSPAWSPDGKRIAFASERGDLTDRPEIWIMNADGSNPIRLTTNNGFDAHPKWSPDGTQIAFASDRNGSRSIYLMNADGTNVRQVTTSPWKDQYPSWSYDGKWLAFDRRTPENRGQIYIVDVAGNNLKQVTNNVFSDQDAIWLP